MTPSEIWQNQLAEIPNFLAISERIGTGGQPAPLHFALLKKAGYQVIINLALPSSTRAIPHEGALTAELDMTYINIPVVWEAPKETDFGQFRAIMQSFRDSRVFVHCAFNMRVSCFMFLYRVLDLGIPEATALIDLHKIWQPDPLWQAFMAAILQKK